MTEKRFTLAYEQEDWWAVRDGDTTLWKEEVVDLLNEQDETIKELTQKKNDLKELLVNSEPVLEQKELQKIIHKRVCAAIDNKINEFKNGDYGDLPCTTVNMFLDLKMEIEQW